MEKIGYIYGIILKVIEKSITADDALKMIKSFIEKTSI